jgi:hypothetical protein
VRVAADGRMRGRYRCRSSPTSRRRKPRRRTHSISARSRPSACSSSKPMAVCGIRSDGAYTHTMVAHPPLFVCGCVCVCVDCSRSGVRAGCMEKGACATRARWPGPAGAAARNRARARRAAQQSGDVRPTRERRGGGPQLIMAPACVRACEHTDWKSTRRSRRTSLWPTPKSRTAARARSSS